ncbi:murein biosynthesis integral membrane protein MurJ [Demequina sediminicola]|uniref:murein biosynthesis integral membrane protein MurJ n=1 Tax=Demequina sediminicola TaxID=1095026 RepID=UPI0007838F4F|nr:lipid II flippase MurJ [Demequina sediminicola]
MTSVDPAEPDETGDADAMPAPPRKSLSRNSAVMVAGTATSRGLGFARNALLVAAIGATSVAANAYDIANRLPNVMFAILAAGVLNAVLVPQMVKAFARPGGKRTVDRILTIGGVLSLAITIIATLSAQLWVHLYTHNWPPEMVALATAFSYWCIPQLFFYCVYTLLGEVLNSREQFGPFMWAPALNNVVAIIGLGIYLWVFGPFIEPASTAEDLANISDWTPDRIALLAGFATLGIAAQALILIVPMVRGGYRWRWQWKGPKGELAVVGTIAKWSLAAVLVEQVAVTLVTRVSAAAAVAASPDIVASNAAYFQAMSLYMVPHSLVTVSLITAMYTGMARFAVTGNIPALRAGTSRGLRVTGVFTIFATIAMLVLAPLITRAAIPTVSGDDVIAISQVLMVMMLGLVPLGATVMIKRLYFALEEARAIFLMHIPMALVWIATAYAFQLFTDPRWWTVGVAFGMALSNWTGVLLRVGGLRRRLGGGGGARVLRTHVRALVAGLVAGVVGLVAVRFAPAAESLSGWGGLFTAVACVIIIGSVMLAVYAAMLKLLHVSEFDEAVAPLMRKIRRN